MTSIQTLGIYEAWQLPLTLAAAMLALMIAIRPVRLFSAVEEWITIASDRPLLSIVIIIAITVGSRVVLLTIIGIQDPIAADEFSIIFQAKTYLAGSLSNKISLTPNFETPYVLLNPTYSSIYPVLRSFPLIIGYLLGIGAFGGVLLSMAALTVAVYWMVREWVNARYGFVAALIVILRFGMFGMWVNSYWGGAFTALGGVLLLGAFKSLKSRPTIAAAAALGLGAVILMTTRPYEGLFYAAPFALALGVHFLRSSAAVRISMAVPAAVAIGLVLGGLSLTLVHNQAVTGDWKLATYVQYQKTTGTTHTLLVQSPVESSQSLARYDVNKRLFANDYVVVERGRRIGSLFSMEYLKFKHYWDFYVGFALFVPFVIGVWALRREPAVLLSGAFLAFALSIGTWSWAHYAAPGFGIVILAVMLGFRDLRVWRPWRFPYGRSLSRTLPLALLIGTAVPLSSALFGVPASRMFVDSMTFSPCCWIHARSLHIAIENEIDRSEDRNIVLADTGPKAPVSELLIANDPKIEDARTIWINDDPEFNVSTINRYAGRRVWHLSWLDDGGPCLQRFQTISGGSGEPLSGGFASAVGRPGERVDSGASGAVPARTHARAVHGFLRAMTFTR